MKGKASIAIGGGGKFPFISICLLVLCVLFALVRFRFSSSLISHRADSNTAVVGSYAKTNSIDTFDDGNDDNDSNNDDNDDYS